MVEPSAIQKLTTIGKTPTQMVMMGTCWALEGF